MKLLRPHHHISVFEVSRHPWGHISCARYSFPPFSYNTHHRSIPTPLSRRPVVLDLAQRLEALARGPQGVLDDALGDGEAGLVARGRVGVAVAAPSRIAVGGLGTAAGEGVAADVVEDAGEEGGVGRDLAGAEEGEGVGLDEGGPVGCVGVEGVEEGVLDSDGVVV